MKTQMETFGLVAPYFCGSRIFFRRMNHPGANNCACPKMDNGVSCVPFEMRDAWLAYVGLTNADDTTQKDDSK